MIYLFDVKKELIKVIPRRNIVSAIQELEINGLYTAEIEVPLFYKTEQGQIFNHKKSFDNALFFGHFDYHKKFQLYKIHNRKIDGKQLIITGVHLFFDEAKAMSVIRDKRLINADARKVANVAFEGTGWTVRDYDTTKEKNIDLYYMTPIDARKLIIEEYNVEFDYDFSFDGRKVTSKNIYIRNKLGRWTGDRYHYGTNILSITQEQDDAEVYTAAIGRGTSDDTNTALNAKVLFDDLTWSKDGYNKPLGQDYLEIVSATEKYGYYDEKTAKIKPRIAIIEFSDIQDQKVLADKTWEWLKQNCVPKVTYSTTVSKVGEYYLGDEIAIIYKEIDIVKKARVENMRVNLLNHDLTELDLGDYTYFKQDKYRERISNEIKETKKEANSYIVKLKKEFDANFEEQTLSFAKAIEQVKINAQSEVESAERRLSEEIDNELNALKQPNALPSSVLQIDELLINRLISDNMFANTLGSNYLFSEIIKTKSLEAVNANISNLRSNILTSNVIKAEHIDSGTALIDKLFSNSANITGLTSKSAFIRNIQAIDIDLNRATVRGSSDDETTVLSGGKIRSTGTFTRTFPEGSATYESYTESWNGTYRSGLISKSSGGKKQTGITRWLSLNDKSVTTQREIHSASPDKNGARFIDFFAEETFGSDVTGQGMHVYSGQALKIESEYGLYLNANKRFYIRTEDSGLEINKDGQNLVLKRTTPYNSTAGSGGSYMSIQSSDGVEQGHVGILSNNRHLSLKSSYGEVLLKGSKVFALDADGVNRVQMYAQYFSGEKIIGNIEAAESNIYAMCHDELRVVSKAGYNGGNITYKNIRANDADFNGISYNRWTQKSREEWKTGIRKWEVNASDVLANEVDIYEFYYKTDLNYLTRGSVIGEGYKLPDFWLSSNKNGVDNGAVLWTVTKGLQEQIERNNDLESRLKILEDKLNESTTA